MNPKAAHFFSKNPSLLRFAEKKRGSANRALTLNKLLYQRVSGDLRRYDYRVMTL